MLILLFPLVLWVADRGRRWLAVHEPDPLLRLRRWQRLWWGCVIAIGGLAIVLVQPWCWPAAFGDTVPGALVQLLLAMLAVTLAIVGLNLIGLRVDAEWRGAVVQGDKRMLYAFQAGALLILLVNCLTFSSANDAITTMLGSDKFYVMVGFVFVVLMAHSLTRRKRLGSLPAGQSRPLERQSMREAILEVAGRAGFSIETISVIDTMGANSMVVNLASEREFVVSDGLVEFGDDNMIRIAAARVMAAYQMREPLQRRILSLVVVLGMIILVVVSDNVTPSPSLIGGTLVVGLLFLASAWRAKRRLPQQVEQRERRAIEWVGDGRLYFRSMVLWTKATLAPHRRDIHLDAAARKTLLEYARYADLSADEGVAIIDECERECDIAAGAPETSARAGS